MSETLELLDLPKDHLSTTSRRMWLRCGRQYWYRYVEGQKVPPDSNLTLGIATHGSLGWSFAEQVATDRHPKTDRILAHFAARLPETIRELQEMAGDEMLRKAGDTDARMLDDGTAMLRLYDTEIGRTLRPERVEAEATVPVSAGTGGKFKILVKVDLRAAGGRLVDYKTTRKRKPEGEATWDSQLTAEQLVEQAARRPVKSLELHVLGRRKSGEAFLQLLKSRPRTEEAKRELLGSFADVATAVRAGIFPKTDQLMQTCSWCGFKKWCRPDFAAWYEKQQAAKAAAAEDDE